MFKIRAILFISAVAITILLFNLPKIVVDNEENALKAEKPGTATDVAEDTETTESHDRQLTTNQQDVINRLRQKYENANNKEKSIIFADSLATVYQTARHFDSAAYFLGQIADVRKTEDAYLSSADAYLEAFNFAVSEDERVEFAQLARESYQQVMDLNPANTEAKANMALTFVTSSSPMKGIMMLREILNEEPNNQTALFNMGLLSVTSGQLDKAIERFNSILDINPEHYEAMLYLGYCHLETGDAEKGKQYLEQVVVSGDDQQKTTAKHYLESIK